MRRIVFFKRRDQVPAGAAILTSPHGAQTLSQFNAGVLETLYVPAALVTGWRATVYVGAIEFLGDGWTGPEIRQAVERATMFPAQPKQEIPDATRPQQ